MNSLSFTRADSTCRSDRSTSVPLPSCSYAIFQFEHLKWQRFEFDLNSSVMQQSMNFPNKSGFTWGKQPIIRHIKVWMQCKSPLKSSWQEKSNHFNSFKCINSFKKKALKRIISERGLKIIHMYFGGFFLYEKLQYHYTWSSRNIKKYDGGSSALNMRFVIISITDENKHRQFTMRNLWFIKLL